MSRGHKFRAIDVSLSKKGTTGHNNYHHYTAHNGTSYGGVCNNRSCICYRERITCKRGKGTFRPNEDEEDGEVVCPGCGHKFEIEELILYNCNVTIKFRYFGESNTQTKSHSPSGSEYVRVGKDKWGNTIWKYYSSLRIICK
mmetsp:Transcript_34027/g.29834  ORF Transcript_34027/g.29834 Transcript_34027/m.29834 type:complete len:142 (-) Transcript_34027:97-522(-)